MLSARRMLLLIHWPVSSTWISLQREKLELVSHFQYLIKRRQGQNLSSTLGFLRGHSVKFGALDWFTISILFPCLATIQQKVYLNTGSCREKTILYYQHMAQCVCQPESLERGGPCWLLKLNGELKEDKWKGPFLGLLGLSCSTRDFCSALAALVGPVQNNFFLTVHYFNSFVPIGQQAGQ